MQGTGQNALVRTLLVLATLLMVLMPAPRGASAEWTVASDGAAGCFLESSPEPVNDGYQTSTAKIRVDGKSVLVTSPSAFDAGFKDIRIVVDEREAFPMDRLADPRTLVFESRYPSLVEHFKRGLRAKIDLRFWPTWPETGLHSVTFALIGFTRAHAQLGECH